MKVTITGASGFIGSSMIDYLKKDYQLVTKSIRYNDNQNINIEGDAIIHLAGKAHDLKNVSNPEDYYKANFELTKQLFDAFLISKASVFIFMSTVKASADHVNGILTENQACNPKTHYGNAKHQAEKYILSQKLPTDKRVYILRPCMVHGPGNKGNLNLLYQLVYKGLPWPLGDFDNKRSFLSIENLCFVINELLQNPSIPAGIYQVADDECLSTNQLIEILGETIQRKTKIWKINSKIINFIAKFGDLINLPLNSERLQKLTESYVVSNQKIVKAIGKTLPVPAEKGLKKTFKSFTNKNQE